MKITIISFSGRANGNCQKIAYKVSEEFSNENVAFYDFSSFYIHPCGACGVGMLSSRRELSIFRRPGICNAGISSQ